MIILSVGVAVMGGLKGMLPFELITKWRERAGAAQPLGGRAEGAWSVYRAKAPLTLAESSEGKAGMIDELRWARARLQGMWV